jgi:hypothetical protein
MNYKTSEWCGKEDEELDIPCFYHKLGTLIVLWMGISLPYLHKVAS